MSQLSVSDAPRALQTSGVARASRYLAVMAERAERLRWRTVARTFRPWRRPQINLWLPLVPVFLLVSPLILLLLGVAVFLPRPLRVNPAYLMLGVGRVLTSLSEAPVDDGRQPGLLKIR